MRRLQRSAPVAVLVLAPVGLAWWLSLGHAPGSARPVRVDFRDVVRPAEASPGNTAAGSMRIAVAAMTSPKLTYACYEDLLRLVGSRMSRSVVFVQRKSYAEVNAMLERRELDLAFVCSGPYVAGNEEFGLELLVVPVVGGEKVYRSYIIVQSDSACQSIEELRGKVFAFTDPLSLSGRLAPVHLLAQKGETASAFFGDAFFTHCHDMSIRSVATARADAAAVDSLVWDFLNVTAPEVTSCTRILWRSPAYGIPPVVVHPAMPAAEKEKLRAVFLALHRDQPGKGMLARLMMDRFELADERLYDSVRELHAWAERSERETP